MSSATLWGTRAARPTGASGRPMSVAVSTSVDSSPSAWPIWVPKIAPPAWPSMPISGPAIALASAGSASPIAATTCWATGSTSWRQVGTVSSIHCARLQPAVVTMPLGKSVTSSSQWSARVIASAMRRSWALPTDGSGLAATARRATSRARFQFTLPS